MAFQKKTLRTLSPLAREVADAINECDATKRRLTRLLGHVLDVELDSLALRRKWPSTASTLREDERTRQRLKPNKGRQTLAELDDAFHSPTPLERQLFGEYLNANP